MCSVCAVWVGDSRSRTRRHTLARGGEVLLYMKVALQVKDGDKWSEPVYGYGGDFIIQKNKNGLVPNDEAYKMCLTDALGNAMKCVGVAADVFRGIYDTKYQKMQEQAKAQADEGANLQKKIFALAKAKKLCGQDACHHQRKIQQTIHKRIERGTA